MSNKMDDPRDQWLPSEREAYYINRVKEIKPDDEPLRENFTPLLPKCVNIVSGMETPIFYENLVSVRNYKDLNFSFDCPFGEHLDSCFVFRPGKSDVGSHHLMVEVKNGAGDTLGTSSCELRVLEPDSDRGDDLNLFFMGASLVANGHFINEFARLLTVNENSNCVFLGSKTSAAKPARPEVFHEGHGGFRWDCFLERCEFDENNEIASKSPFIFERKPGVWEFDLERYGREVFGGRTPDLVFILLGLNDLAWSSAKSVRLLDQDINKMFDYSEQLIAAIKELWPDVHFGLLAIPSGNVRDSAYEMNYAKQNPAGWSVGLLHRWNFKLVQYHALKKQMERWEGRENENIFMVPTSLSLDTVNGFPENNAGHPNLVGQEQMGLSIYSWFKYWLKEERIVHGPAPHSLGDGG